MDIVYQGDDIPITVSLKDSAGTPIAVSTYSAIKALVVHQRTKIPIRKFTLDGTDSSEVIEVVDNAGGIIRLRLDRAHTASAETGEYQLEIRLTKEDDEYQDNQYARSSVFERLFHLKNTKLSNG